MLKSRATIQTTSEPPEEPTLETISPELAEMRATLQKFFVREREILDKISANTAMINASGLALFEEQNIQARKAADDADGKPPRMKGVSSKAAALLGKFTPAPTPAPSPLYHEPPLAKEQHELGVEYASVVEAIKALQPQITRAHLEASARLCDLLRPQYKVIAARICAALVELGKAEIAQRDFMHKHRGVARSTLRVVHATGGLGDPRDYQSEFRRLLYWAAECGHFDLADLPADWPGPRDTAGIHSWPVT
jgi:hypothetical protein